MKNSEDKPAVLLPKKHIYTHKTELKIGNWKNNFDLNYTQTLIAIALNHCCKYHDLIINGYLITAKSLYLVAKTHEKSIDMMLNKIEDHISLLLKDDNRIVKNKKYNIDFMLDNEDVFFEIQEPFFKVYPLKNDYMIPLITGKKIELPYYDRRLEALKQLVHHHPFCSAVDYSGAIGPVQVTLLKD
ncbi:hypothetical protein [Flavobacterium sp. ENC]|uniref:hypothetical protein n=1 Tax=Flavobacterium sp. ENC TaxID=2897330 RepID=UPI001E63F1F6|nr:hypothetical protein [Flavobacterium sp. ENC]MCD0465048.1 hypothetical protein [Flavobacterium sp. ENC]